MCLCCETELFTSETKFNSSCGWPAFYAASKNEENIERTEDNSHGMKRVEVTCKKVFTIFIIYKLYLCEYF